MMAKAEKKGEKTKASIVVASNNSLLKERMQQFFSQRENQVFYEDVGSGAILRLIEEPIDILMVDVEDCIVKSSTGFHSDILDVIRRLRPDLQIISFVDDASVETYRHLSKKGILYRATKPVQLPEIAIILKSLETVNKKRFPNYITFPGLNAGRLPKSSNMSDGVNWSEELSIGLIFSHTQSFRKRIARLFERIHFSFIFEQLKTNTLLRILELNPRVIMIEDDEQDTDRFNFVRLIRRLRPRVPIIVITTSTSKKDYRAFLNSGISRCIVKPAETKEIDSLISYFASQKMMINVS